MADEQMIKSRIVITGIDEAKQQVKALNTLLKETKQAYEQARRKESQETEFQGSIKNVKELLTIVNQLQGSISQLNSEIAKGSPKGLAKTAKEELQVNAQIAKEEIAIAKQKANEVQRLARENAKYAVEQAKAKSKELADWEKSKAGFKPTTVGVYNQQKVDDAMAVFAPMQTYRQQISKLNADIMESYQNMVKKTISPEQYAKDLSKYQVELKKAEQAQKDFNKSIGNSSTAMSVMMERIKSHATWIMAGGLIAGLVGIPMSFFNTLKEVETGMAGLAQVNTELHHSQDALDKQTMKLMQTTSYYGENIKDVIEVSKLWGRAYKDIGVVNTFVSKSMELAVADNMNLMDATNGLEAAMFQYGLTAKNSTEAMAYASKIVDVYTKVSHNAQVSATDLTKGVSQAGSVAHLTGVDFEFLTAMIASGVRATAKSGNEIGTMIKSVLGSFRTEKAQSELEKIGITVKEIGTDGVEKFRKAQDVLLDLALTAQTTDKDLGSLYQAISGGKWQWSKASAMLGDFNEFIKVWGMAVNSQGFTAGQVGLQLDTMSRKIEKIKTDVQSLYVGVGQTGARTAIKETLNLIDNLIVGLGNLSKTEFATISGSSLAIVGIYKLINGYKAYQIAVEGATVANYLFSRSNVVLLGITVLAGAILAYVENVGKMKNKTQEAIATMQNERAVMEQQIEQYKKQADFIDALFVARQKITKEMESGTLSAEKHAKSQKNLEEVDKQLTATLGQDSMERIRQNNFSVESIQRERDEFRKSVEKKQEALNNFMIKQNEALDKQLDDTQKKIDDYWKEAEEYAKSKKSMADVLTFWEQARLKGQEMNTASLERQKTKTQETISDMEAHPEKYQYAMGGATLDELKANLTDINKKIEESQTAGAEIISGSKYIQNLNQQIAEINKARMDNMSKVINFDQPPAGGNVVNTGDTNDKQLKSLNNLENSTESLQQKYDNFSTKSINNQMEMLNDQYKSNIANIEDLENRYGKSYEFLDEKLRLSKQNAEEIKRTISELTDQFNKDLDKVNSLSGSVTVKGGVTELSDKFYNITSDVSDRNITALTEQKLNLLSKDYYDKFGQKLDVTSMMRSGDTGSWHSTGQAVDVVSSILESNSNARKWLMANASRYGLTGLDEYETPSPNATGGHLHFTDKGMPLASAKTIDISGINLESAGLSMAQWKAMSTEQKREFIEQHKNDIKDSKVLLEYLKQLEEEQKSINDYQRQYNEAQKEYFKEVVKGISEVQAFQNEMSDLEKRSNISKLGLGATDADKAVADLIDLKNQLNNATQALNKAKAEGLEGTLDYRKMEVSRQELEAKVKQQSAEGVPEAKYKETLKDIEYRQKLSTVGLTDETPLETQQAYIANLTAATEKVEALKQALKEMREESNGITTDKIKDYEIQLKEAEKEAKNLSNTLNNRVKNAMYNVTNDLLLQGKSMKEIWKNLWNDLANDALKALFKINNGSQSTLGGILSLFGLGGKGSSAGFDFGFKGFGVPTGGFFANGGVTDKPSIFGEDGEEVAIPLERNKGNSYNLLKYAANRLGVSSGITPDFKNPEIAEKAVSVSVNSANQMQKTNSILVTQNQILTTMLNQMGQQQNAPVVIMNNGQGQPSLEEQANAYNRLRTLRMIGE